MITGSSGIAVGMATNIPPHNLSEVIAACLHVLHHPQCAIEELIKLMPAPYFPTAGIINGARGIHEAYHTGRGRIYVRARIEIEEDGRPVAFGGWSGPSAEALFLRLDGEGEEASVSIGEDGRYYLLVPRGTYLLAQVSRRFDPRAAFRVPDGDDACYLGTLRLDVTSEPLLVGRSYSLKGVRVTDGIDEARRALAQRFPAFEGSVGKSLLVHSEEIPGAAEAREQLRQKQQSQRLMWHIYNVLQTLNIKH